MIRMVDEKDATEITDIYNHYVLTSTATFEVDTITVQDMKARIAAITGTYPWLVLEEDGAGTVICPGTVLAHVGGVAIVERGDVVLACRWLPGAGA